MQGQGQEKPKQSIGCLGIGARGLLVLLLVVWGVVLAGYVGDRLGEKALVALVASGVTVVGTLPLSLIFTAVLLRRERSTRERKELEAAQQGRRIFEDQWYGGGGGLVPPFPPSQAPNVIVVPQQALQGPQGIDVQRPLRTQPPATSGDEGPRITWKEI